MKKENYFHLAADCRRFVQFHRLCRRKQGVSGHKKDIMLKNEEGTYTKAQVIAPSDF